MNIESKLRIDSRKKHECFWKEGLLKATSLVLQIFFYSTTNTIFKI